MARKLGLSELGITNNNAFIIKDSSGDVVELIVPAETVLARGAAGEITAMDEAAFKSAFSIGEVHTQNTDTGTTSTTFQIDSGNSGALIKSDGSGNVLIRNDADNDYASLTVKNLNVTGMHTINNTASLNVENTFITLNSDYTGTSPEDASIIVERGDYTNAEITWNETFNVWMITNPADSGDPATSYAILHSGQIVNDLTTGGALAVLSAEQGKELQDTKVGNALFDANTILKADSDDTPSALTVGTNTIVGRADGSIDAIAVGEATVVGRETGGNLAALNNEALLENFDLYDRREVIAVDATAVSNGYVTLSSDVYDDTTLEVWVGNVMQHNIALYPADGDYALGGTQHGRIYIRNDAAEANHTFTDNIVDGDVLLVIYRTKKPSA